MTSGQSFPMTGIKVGQEPAHRSTAPQARFSASATTPKPVTAPAAPNAATVSSASPTTRKNEVEVTTSDQVSEHIAPSNARANNHASSPNPQSAPPRGQSSDRRTAMGVASIRIAGRLTQNELGSRTGDIRTADASVGPDELLQLLGEYLMSGGLQAPELHVRSNGQNIVLDLSNPAKGFR